MFSYIDKGWPHAVDGRLPWYLAIPLIGTLSVESWAVVLSAGYLLLS